VSDLTLNVAVKRDTTILSVRGTADASRCQLLRDGFHVARTLRKRGPIVVDLAGVDRLAAVGLLALRQAADAARGAGRQVTVRHLRPGIVDDPRSLLLRHTVCGLEDTLPSTAGTTE
jgi:anti-anti-sigma regulatory factor